MNISEQPIISPTSDFYQRVCEEASVALVATDRELRIICWNQAAEKLFGLPASEQLGDDFRTLMPDDTRDDFSAGLIESLTTGEISQFEMEIYRLDGQTRTLLMTIAPIHDAQGQAEGLACWVMDETKARQISRKLSQAERMSSLGAMAGGVAHYFNNILGGVATFVDFALSQNDPALMKRALVMAAEGATRANKLTQQLLSIGAAEHGREDLSDLTEILLTFTHMMEQPLAEKGIELELALKPVPVIEVDGLRMHQVLQNLASNAEDAMPEGGQLKLAIEHIDNEVVLTMSDTGEGIADEMIDQIFEPFFTTKGVVRGGHDPSHPGLGLAVVHGIMEDFGGSISLESHGPGGSTFALHFSIEP